MKKLLLACLLSSTLSLLQADAPAPATDYAMPLKTQKEQAAVPRVVRLILDVSENDIQEYGLQLSTINTEIATRLQLAQIQIKDEQGFPQLVLRIKSILADRAIATFVQMSYAEDATLSRTLNSVMAITWSQATMISCAKEDLVREVTQVVVQMTNNFILDYQKVMSQTK